MPRKILIIGGANGVGRATTEQLLAQTNDELIVIDRDQKKLSEIQARAKRNFETLVLDMTDRAGVLKMASLLGKIDALVICAAIHSSYPAEYLSDEMIDQVLNINLTAQIKLIRDLLPLIPKGGKIIGVSSIAAGLGVPMESLYSASKAGLEAFFESLAVELTYRKIAVSVIHPGNINTGFNEKGNDYKPTGNKVVDEGYKRVVSGIDSSKGMPPQDVANVIIKALNSKKPKFGYIVGLNAIKATWAKRILGRNFALKLMAKYFGF